MVSFITKSRGGDRLALKNKTSINGLATLIKVSYVKVYVTVDIIRCFASVPGLTMTTLRRYTVLMISTFNNFFRKYCFNWLRVGQISFDLFKTLYISIILMSKKSLGILRSSMTPTRGYFARYFENIGW